MFFSKNKTYLNDIYIEVLNGLFKSLVFLLLLCITFYSNAQSEELTKEQTKELVDSLVSTFPYLIVDSAEQGRQNVEKALELNQLNNSIEVEAFGNYCLGFYNRIKGNNRTAIRYHKKAFNYYVELENVDRKVLIMNELGIVYKNLGEYEESLKYYIDGIEIAKKNKLKRLADLYSNLAVVHTLLDNYEQGLLYLFKSLDLEADLIGRQTILLNIGIIYKESKQDSLAMVYYREALDICDENDLATYYRNDVLHNIADALVDSGEASKALTYLNEIKKYEEAENNIRDLVFTYLSLARAYQKMKEFSNAQYYYNKCIALGLKAESNEQLLIAYELLSGLYKEAYNYKKSLDTYEKYVVLKDSLFNIEKVKYTENLLADFDADKRENEILLLKKEHDFQEKELQANQRLMYSHKVIRNISIIVAVLLLLGAFVIVFFYQQKLRDGQLLAMKIEEVNKQEIYSLLRDQEFNVIESEIEGRDKERKRIAQELHDGIGGNLASIKLNLANIIDDGADNKLKMVMRNIDDTCKEVRAISHNLISIKIMNHSFVYLVNRFLEDITIAEKLKVKINFFPEEKLNKLSNELKIELYRVIQELMSNIMKYSEAEFCDIQLIERDGCVNLLVEDDGVGFDTTQATQGIGLRNIRSRIKALNGDFTIESSKGNWTIVNIEIPLAKE